MVSKFRVSDGKAAIWSGGSDLAPFNNPLGNISRVKFHSALDYLTIIDERPYTLKLPAIYDGTLERTASYQLGPHGRPGVPLFLAKTVLNGVPVAFTGSIPVHANPNGEGYARWLAIGADATHIIVHEYAVQEGSNRGTPQGVVMRPAQTLSIVCYITDELL